MWPNLNGATVWFSPSYSAQTGLFYVAAREIGAEYFKLKAESKPGMLLAGGGEHTLPADDTWGALPAPRVAPGENAMGVQTPFPRVGGRSVNSGR